MSVIDDFKRAIRTIWERGYFEEEDTKILIAPGLDFCDWIWKDDKRIGLKTSHKNYKHNQWKIDVLKDIGFKVDINLSPDIIQISF